MMKNFTGYLAAVALLGVGLLAAPQTASAAPIIYDVNRTIGAGSVVGTIETNGTLGVLTAGNILSWSLTLSSPDLAGGSPDVITSPGIQTFVSGTGLTATATQLIFDFGTANNSILALQGFDFNAWCITSGPTSCAGVEATPSEGIYFSGSTGGAAELTHPTGVEVIATVAAVPEPSTLALLGAGLFGWGALRRRRAASQVA